MRAKSSMFMGEGCVSEGLDCIYHTTIQVACLFLSPSVRYSEWQLSVLQDLEDSVNNCIIKPSLIAKTGDD